MIFVILKFKTYSFKIYGIWPQVSKQASKAANIHTNVRNAVQLEWGLLRLAPMNPRCNTSTQENRAR